MHDDSSDIRTIQECELAIGRVRAAIRAAQAHAEPVGADLEFILDAVAPRFVRYARRVAFLGPEAFEEALDALRDRLLDDIWSLGYVTMETKFGSYLKTRPLRVLQQIARKYGRSSVSSPVARLDQPAGAGGQPLAELLADAGAGDAIERLAEREAILQALDALPPEERLVFRQRLAGVSNNDIARQLDVTPATTSRMYQRAVARLQGYLSAVGEFHVTD